MQSIAIIDPGVIRPELDCFNRLTALSPLRLTYHLPALFGFSSLQSLESPPKALVILGSACSVNDRLEWQLVLADWVRDQLKRSIPILGICFAI
jgi:hypothetical protein